VVISSPMHLQSRVESRGHSFSPGRGSNPMLSRVERNFDNVLLILRKAWNSMWPAQGRYCAGAAASTMSQKIERQGRGYNVSEAVILWVIHPRRAKALAVSWKLRCHKVSMNRRNRNLWGCIIKIKLQLMIHCRTACGFLARNNNNNNSVVGSRWTRKCEWELNIPIMSTLSHVRPGRQL